MVVLWVVANEAGPSGLSQFHSHTNIDKAQCGLLGAEAHLMPPASPLPENAAAGARCPISRLRKIIASLGVKTGRAGRLDWDAGRL